MGVTRREVVLGAALAGGLLAALGACAAFESDPSPAPTAEDIGVPPVAFDAGVVPSFDRSSGCATGEKPPTLAFCSDFDDPKTGYADWRMEDTEGTYTTASSPFVSAPSSARIALARGGGGSPDARIRRSIGNAASGTRFAVAGWVRIENRETGVYKQLIRLDLKNETGAVWIKPNGALVEARRNGDNSTTTYTSTAGTLDLTDNAWHAFWLFVDFSTNNRIAIAEVDGKRTSLALGEAKRPCPVDAVLGPAEPSVADQPATVYFDNVRAYREP